MNPRTSKGIFGEALVVDGPLNEDYVRMMADKDIRELNLNVYLGFDSQSLPFLAGIPHLDGLSILVSSSTDISIIQELGDLRGLTIGGPTSVCLDFSRFPRLERVALIWSEGVSSILSCSSLKSMFLNNYNGIDMAGFNNLPALTHLSIACSSIGSLTGIGAMPNLEKLWLQRAPKLASLEGMQGLHALRFLLIETCRKIGNLGPIRDIVSLENIFLRKCGNIESLEPIKNLKNLTSIAFGDTNILDGDLSYLDELPNLAEAYFDNRKHYSAKREKYPPWNTGEKVMLIDSDPNEY